MHFNNGSRAEQTLATELYKKRKRENLPPNFKQKFVTINQKQFPCHPLEGSRHFDFPVGFDGCLGCGSEDHRFHNCKTKIRQKGRNIFISSYIAIIQTPFSVISMNLATLKAVPRIESLRNMIRMVLAVALKP